MSINEGLGRQRYSNDCSEIVDFGQKVQFSSREL